MPRIEGLQHTSCRKPTVHRPSSVESKIYSRKLVELRQAAEELENRNKLVQLLNFDLYTHMPINASESRARQMMQLTKMQSEKLRSKRLSNIVAHLQECSGFENLSPVDKALLSEVSRRIEREKKVSPKLQQEISEAFARARVIWTRAKPENDFKSFADILEKIISLNKELAQQLGTSSSAYETLLNEHEPGVTVKQLDEIFLFLREHIIPLLHQIQDTEQDIDTSFLKKRYDQRKQIEFSKLILQRMGFDLSNISISEAAHPDCLFVGQNDIRIVTQTFLRNPVPNITSTTHEGGHGLYYDGLGDDVVKTILGTRSSWGMDEAQARFYETIIGLGMPFWSYFYPKLKKLFPTQLKGISLEKFVRAINKVQPSLIRIDADEVTYNLHVILRYEIEKALFDGDLKVEDAPEYWNEKMESYLGIKPNNDKSGIMQDMHWADGYICFFPCYTLGNLYAAQLYNRICEEIPDLEEQIASGDLTQVRNWLRENVHQFGKSKSSSEIIEYATGEELNPRYFIEYLNRKFIPQSV